MKFFQKALLTALAVCILTLPLSSMALAGQTEASSPVADQSEAYVPGQVPAQTGVVDTMTPALHGVILAMLNHDVSTLNVNDTDLMWESLYNMLSLYGQLDERSQMEGDVLTFPSETVRDYAAALVSNYPVLGSLPPALADRLTYDSREDCYQVACGSDDLAQLQVRDVETSAEGIRLEGALVYLVDGTDLVRFEATLEPRDTMFGYAITQFVLK